MTNTEPGLPARIVRTETSLRGFHVTVGTELTAELAEGRRRLSFRRLVITPTSSWVDAWDGRMTRSVKVDRVLRVHRSRRMEVAK